MYSYWPALNTLNTYASRAAKHEQGITTVFLSDQHNHATKYGLPFNMCLHVCTLIHIYIYIYIFRMQTCPRSCQAQCIVIMCCTSAQKNTSKAGSAATSAQVYLSTIVFTYVFLYIYDLPLNFSRKHCVNTYTHTLRTVSTWTTR